MTSAEATYYTHSRPEMMGFLPSNRNRLLEIGCGQGVFASTIDHVSDRWAVEPNAEAAAAASSRFDHVLNGLFNEVRDDLPKAYFDLVICNDVIEHMIDHEKFLIEIKDHLSPGGALVGSIPYVRYYKNLFELIFEKDWHYRDAGTLDRTHLRFFTQKSWSKALAAAGFKIEALAGINPYSDTGSKRDRTYAGLAKVISSMPFGYFNDVAYMQFGFRAIKA